MAGLGYDGIHNRDTLGSKTSKTSKTWIFSKIIERIHNGWFFPWIHHYWSTCTRSTAEFPSHRGLDLGIGGRDLKFGCSRMIQVRAMASNIKEWLLVTMCGLKMIKDDKGSISRMVSNEALGMCGTDDARDEWWVRTDASWWMCQKYSKVGNPDP